MEFIITSDDFYAPWQYYKRNEKTQSDTSYLAYDFNNHHFSVEQLYISFYLSRKYVPRCRVCRYIEIHLEHVRMSRHFDMDLDYINLKKLLISLYIHLHKNWIKF